MSSPIIGVEQAERDLKALEAMLGQKRQYRVHLEERAARIAEEHRQAIAEADESIEALQGTIRRGWEAVTWRRAQGDRFQPIEIRPAVFIQGIEEV